MSEQMKKVSICDTKFFPDVLPLVPTNGLDPVKLFHPTCLIAVHTLVALCGHIM